MPKFRIEFDTDDLGGGDTKIFRDEEELTREVHSAVFVCEAYNQPLFYYTTGRPREDGYTTRICYMKRVRRIGPSTRILRAADNVDEAL